MKNFLISTLALLTLWSGSRAAEQMKATVEVFGRDVVVRVSDRDGRPAAGIPIRLLYGRQFAVAVARTNENGNWAHTVSQTGAYEAIVESGKDVQAPIRLPFIALDSETKGDLIWLVAGPGLACLFGAGLLLVDRLRNAEGRSLRLGRVAVVLSAAGVSLLGWSAWSYARHATAAEVSDGVDVAREAREFLRSQNVQPLSAPLEQLLADPYGERIPTQAHPLIGQLAPDFELIDCNKNVWHLRDRLDRGPVVLTFYFGYHCNHCVGQLFALHDDHAKFRELGANVVAVSADPPELTRQRFRQYGEFAFPVVADPGNAVAQKFGVYRPATPTAREDLLHATFVIGRDGRVCWAYCGNDPFTGNLTLLSELARSEGRR
jgi:peroxiredoxin